MRNTSTIIALSHDYPGPSMGDCEFTLEDLDASACQQRDVHDMELLSMSAETLHAIQTQLSGSNLTLESQAAMASVSDLFLRQESFFIRGTEIRTAPNPMTMEDAFDTARSIGKRVWDTIVALAKKIGKAIVSLGDYILRLIDNSKSYGDRLKVARRNLSKVRTVVSSTLVPSQPAVSGLFTKPIMRTEEITKLLNDSLPIINTLYHTYREIAKLQVQVASEAGEIKPEEIADLIKATVAATGPGITTPLPGNQMFVTVVSGRSTTDFGGALTTRLLDDMNITGSRLRVGFTGKPLVDGNMIYSTTEEIVDLADALDRYVAVMYGSYKMTSRKTVIASVAKWDDAANHHEVNASLTMGLLSIPTHRYMSELNRYIYRIYRAGVMLVEQAHKDITTNSPDVK